MQRFYKSFEPGRQRSRETDENIHLGCDDILISSRIEILHHCYSLLSILFRTVYDKHSHNYYWFANMPLGSAFNNKATPSYVGSLYRISNNIDKDSHHNYCFLT